VIVTVIVTVAAGLMPEAALVTPASEPVIVALPVPLVGPGDAGGGVGAGAGLAVGEVGSGAVGV